MPSSKQRLEVWRGIRAKTSGGLRKEDLVKNKRGKIVSKRKSEQAGEQNNLGDFLRKEGTKVPKDKMLYKKGAKPPSSPKKKKAAVENELNTRIRDEWNLLDEDEQAKFYQPAAPGRLTCNWELARGMVFRGFPGSVHFSYFRI